MEPHFEAMKKIYLTKNVDIFEVAHLYEHLFCIEFSRVMKAEGLFRSLDYDYLAETYEDGRIYFSTYAINSKAEEVVRNASTIQPAFDHKDIELSLLSISAEESCKFDNANISAISQLLEQAQQVPWALAEDADYHPNIGARIIEHPSIVATPIKKTAICSIDLVCVYKSAGVVHPLETRVFADISNILLDNFCDELKEAFGCYFSSAEIKAAIDNKKLTNTWKLSILKDKYNRLEPRDIMSVIDSQAGKIMANDFTHRVSIVLSRQSKGAYLSEDYINKILANSEIQLKGLKIKLLSLL